MEVLEASEDATRALHGKDLMPLFYISEDNENDVQRCQESRLEGRPITITAIDIDGKVAAFTSRSICCARWDPETRAAF